MNYPVWLVPFGSFWLIAFIAVFHVFIAQFAVGGGFFLVLMERDAHRHDDEPMKAWLSSFSKIFVILTLVFGAVTGVGIWFTIGLISPEATSALIHLFVWVWAMEWCFFLVEILSILVYYSSWGKTSQRTHMAVGWTYVIAAFMSLVLINGILSFQLTPGRWLLNHGLRVAFFNPTMWPSMVFRTLLALVLAGLFALVSVAFQPDRTLRAEVAKRAARWLWLPAVLLPFAGWWYLVRVPKVQKTAFVQIPNLKPLGFALVGVVALLVMFSLFLAWLKSRMLRKGLAFFMLFLGLAAVGLSEWVREELRSPYLVASYIYSNSIPVHMEGEIKQAGILGAARFVPDHKLDKKNELQSGKAIFEISCSSCHLASGGPRPLSTVFANFDPQFAGELVQRTNLMWGRMPPFSGTTAEARAVAAYLQSLAPTAPISMAGKAVWERHCGMCHTLDGPFRPILPALQGMGPDELAPLIENIQAMNPAMPSWSGTQKESQVLARYLSDRAKAIKQGGAP
ncbi:MAG: c-type cytochrome [Acidobacteriota bacterium]